MNKLTGLILMVSLVVRLVGLNQSLWLDEAISINVAKSYSYGGIIRDFSPSDFHPPLYYLTLKAWMSVWGSSEVAARSLSVIFSMLTIYIVYRIAGSGGAALVGFNPLLVYYSQEARMYSMVTCLLAAILYFLVKKNTVLVNFLSILAIFTYYPSVFLIGILTLWNGWRYGIGLGLGLGLVSPLIFKQQKTAKLLLTEVVNWKQTLGTVNFKNIWLILTKFTSGRISFYPKLIYYGMAGVWAVIVWIRLLRRKITKEQIWFWGTLILGTLFSLVTPMFQYFRFLYLIPLMAIILKRDWLVAGGFLIFSLVYVTNPAFYREDWKSLSKELGKSVYMITSVAEPVKYYQPEVKINDLKIKPTEAEITVIPYASEIHGLDYRKNLAGYRLVEEKAWRGVTLEKWKREETSGGVR